MAESSATRRSRGAEAFDARRSILRCFFTALRDAGGSHGWIPTSLIAQLVHLPQLQDNARDHGIMHSLATIRRFHNHRYCKVFGPHGEDVNEQELHNPPTPETLIVLQAASDYAIRSHVEGINWGSWYSWDMTTWPITNVLGGVFQPATQSWLICAFIAEALVRPIVLGIGGQ
jgi:hypothetical protein